MTDTNTHNSVLTINNASDTTFTGLIKDGATGATASGFVTVAKAGAGTLTLGSANTYSGGTSITGGTLSISADNNLGAVPAAGSNNIFLNGGTLLVTAGTLSTNRNILVGDSTTTSSGTLRLGSGLALTYGGIIGGTGSLNVAGPANSTLALSGTSSTFTGGVSVDTLTFVFTAAGNDTTLNTLGAGAKNITITNGATIRPTGTFDPAVNTKNFIFGVGGGTIDMPNGSSFLLNDGNPTVANQPNQLQGTGLITITGTGTGVVRLGDTFYNYSGGISLVSGNLQIENNSTGTTPWAASTARALGVIIVPTTPNGFFYEVTATSGAGTSGATPPTFSTTVGATVTDNLLTYTVRAAPTGPLGTGPLTISGGTIRSDGTARSVSVPVNITNDFTTGNTAGSNILTLNASVETTGGGSINFNGGRTITALGQGPLATAAGLSLVGTIVGGAGLTKAGTGDLGLTGGTTAVAALTTSTIGPVNILAGKVTINSTVSAQANIQASMGTGTYSVAAGAELGFSAPSAGLLYQIPNTITVAPGGALGARTNATATLTGVVSMTPDASNTLYFNADDQSGGILVLTTIGNIAATSDLTIQVGLNGFGTDFPFSLTSRLRAWGR